MDSFIELLGSVSYVSYALAGIFFVVTVVLFFVYDIRGTIDDLTGKSKTKQTVKMSNTYAVTGTLRKNTSETDQEEANTTTLKRPGSGQDRKGGNTQRTKTGSLQGFSLVKNQIVVHTKERM